MSLTERGLPEEGTGALPRNVFDQIDLRTVCLKTVYKNYFFLLFDVIEIIHTEKRVVLIKIIIGQLKYQPTNL